MQTNIVHVYNDHAYKEMTLITKRLWIVNFSLKCYVYSEVEHNESRIYM